MHKWKKGWKVINKETRLSCTYEERSNPVHYKKNKTVGKPLFCGPLAVFKTRRAARNFLFTLTGILPTMQIVKCVYTESKHCYVWEKDYIAMWPLYTYDQLPQETVLAEKVKCLE